MNYNEYSKQAHETAVNHGFWKTKYSNEHFLMLVCTEIAEIIEADRKDRHANVPLFLKFSPRAFERFSMTENAFGLIKGLSKGQIAVEKRIQFGLDYLVGWAKCNGINLEWHVKQKMRFNQGCPERHGKKY